MPPKPPKVNRVGMDENMDGKPSRGSRRLTHCPNMQNEVIVKSKVSFVYQKTPHL
jgi:hypothetical protein